MTFKWPALNDQQPAPVWTGHGFMVGSEKVPILCYHQTSSGWSPELTQLHEEVVGSNHYIDRASRQNALDLLAPVLQKENPAILEIGCSSGFFLEELARKAPHATLIGSDFISGPLYKLAERLPGIPIVQFDLTRCPLESDSLDGAVLLNVLEHIEDDSAAFAQLYHILKPGGIAIIEVPAGPKLYDFYDRQLMHYRRYKLGNLKSMAKSAGFTVTKASHLGFFLYPPFALMKKRNQRLEKQLSQAQLETLVTQQMSQGSNSSIMNVIMKMELTLGKIVQYPVGIRCLLTLKK